MYYNFSQLKRLSENYNFSASGAIGHVAQQFIPIYGLANNYKKAKVLNKYDKGNMFDKGDAVAGNYLGQILGLGALSVGSTGSRFQDLVDEMTEEFVRNNPGVDVGKARSYIKNMLYQEGKIYAPSLKAKMKLQKQLDKVLKSAPAAAGN